MSQNEIGMGVLGDIVRRSASTLMRAEERASLIIYNKIHNDKSRGSKNIFREEQLCLLGKIAEQAEDYFNEYSLKRDVGLTEIEVPEIFLVSYKKWLVWQQQRCESAFAKKMRAKYEEEKAELEKIRQSNPKEYDKAERKLKKKYGPWICEAKECCEGCVRVKRTSLGWFDPDRYEICICLDKIMDIYPKEKVNGNYSGIFF